MKRLMTFSVLVFLLVLGLLLWSMGTFSGDDPAPDTADTTSSMPARPDCPEVQLGGVQLDCLGGQTSSSNAEAQWYVVNVWAWWCEPCRAELPLFDELTAQHPEFSVLGVHADPAAARGAALLQELGLELPSLQDDTNRFAGTVGLPSVVPITVVFDSQGSLVQYIPQSFSSYAELEQAVEAAIAR